MLVDGLPIPALLLEALETGRWPRTADEANRQNSRPLVSEDYLRRPAPDEPGLYLYAPPFHTVARILVGRGADFYRRFGAVDQLVPEAAVEIGDFGLGSDSPILLDYRGRPTDPRVISLRWPGDGRPNVWTVLTPDFPTFVRSLGW